MTDELTIAQQSDVLLKALDILAEHCALLVTRHPDTKRSIQAIAEFRSNALRDARAALNLPSK